MNSRIVVYLSCLVMVASAGVYVASEYNDMLDNEVTIDNDRNLQVISSDYSGSVVIDVPSNNGGGFIDNFLPFIPSDNKL